MLYGDMLVYLCLHIALIGVLKTRLQSPDVGPYLRQTWMDFYDFSFWSVGNLQ